MDTVDILWWFVMLGTFVFSCFVNCGWFIRLLVVGLMWRCGGDLHIKYANSPHLHSESGEHLLYMEIRIEMILLKMCRIIRSDRDPCLLGLAPHILNIFSLSTSFYIYACIHEAKGLLKFYLSAVFFFFHFFAFFLSFFFPPLFQEWVFAWWGMSLTCSLQLCHALHKRMWSALWLGVFCLLRLCFG